MRVYDPCNWEMIGKSGARRARMPGPGRPDSAGCPAMRRHRSAFDGSGVPLSEKRNKRVQYSVNVSIDNSSELCYTFNAIS